MPIIAAHPKDQYEKRMDSFEDMVANSGGGVGEFIDTDHTSERFNDYRDFDNETLTGGNWSNMKFDHVEGYQNHILAGKEYEDHVQSGWNHAEGYDNTMCRSYRSHIGGVGNTLGSYKNDREYPNYDAVVIGRGNNAKNLTASVIGGSSNTVTGSTYYSVVLGELNAVNDYTQSSAVLGKSNTVGNAYYSIVAGYNNRIIGTLMSSLVLGHDNEGSGEGTLICGSYARPDSSHRIAVGNGNHNAPGCCFTVDDSGVVSATRYDTRGADYAEYFEWADGNSDNEDRCGMLVELSGDKIALAHGDDIFGIVSAAPSVVGNACELHWQGKYARDVFGRVITAPDGSPLISPDFDPDIKYIARSKRHEWAVVGMIGRLVIIDDGSCKVGGYVSARHGIGTSCSKNTGVRVLRRIDDRHIEVIIK